MSGSNAKVYRIIDANANRAREGLRVVEEVARFILDNQKLTGLLKKIRHQISVILKKMPAGSLISERNSTRDVGKENLGTSEGKRRDYQEIVKTNLHRVTEALRSLEEFSKLIDSAMGEQFKTLRFQVYALEKEILVYLLPKKKWLSGLLDKKFYAIIDTGLLGEKDYYQFSEQILSAGARFIQLRDKVSSDRKRYEVASRLRDMINRQGAAFIVNDCLEIALAVEATGVHLGQDDLPVTAARALLGEGKMIGISTHNEEQALAAENMPVDYIAVGPIYRTETKVSQWAPVGPKLVEKVKKKTRKPVVAIGGINHHNAAEVITAGADAVAVVSAIVCAEDVKYEVEEFLRRLG